MAEALIAAIIAGVISLSVSGIGFLSAWLALRAKSREIERQIRSSYMERLYQMRLEHYPKAFELTKTITRPPRQGRSFSKEELLAIRSGLGEWLNGPAGLIASAELMNASYGLRDVLGSNYGESGKFSRIQHEKIVATVAAFRKELREDVRFLHLADHSRVRDVV